MPRWQRRYCWGQLDIERLVDDLLAIAKANPDASHYAGTLLTFPEPGAAGVLSTIRVVDGQQRLTTVSILLGCIAKKLERDGRCGDWTTEIIRERRLTNPHMPQEKRFKLRLQSEDDDEFRCGLNGKPQGSGAVAQAWKIARRLVDRCDTVHLLTGLERLRVVSIGLGTADDPQQIFESLNATGRPLTESEKVKNWLLIGLPEEEQQELYDRYWRTIEQALGTKHTTEPIDLFLRDVMRWKTGELKGIDKTYELLRRWALKEGYANKRSTLFSELARLAKLYGILTGTAGKYPDRKVEAELRYLRDIGFDIHRPLTLRLLDDVSQTGPTTISNEDLAKVIAGIGTWITRLWLSERKLAGMNRDMIDLARAIGRPSDGESYVEHWLNRIRSLRNRRTGVPDDETVREGVRTRKAYGGAANRITFAMLCELMEAEHPGEAPVRDRLTLEHIMPQKLTSEWQQDLGEEAERVHGQYRDLFANLTLSGDEINSSMGANTFAAKREVYQRSSVGMTRRVANEAQWDEGVMIGRAEDLADRMLERWPWNDPQAIGREATLKGVTFKWRIEDGLWQIEKYGNQMLLNLIGELLSLNPLNSESLQGNSIHGNIHPASRFPPGPLGGTTRMLRAIPGHDDWVFCPNMSSRSTVEMCRKLGERCGVGVQVEIVSDQADVTEGFWKFFKNVTGGISGQNEKWRGGHQRTKPCNMFGDTIGIYVGNTDLLWLFVRAGGEQTTNHSERMRRISQMICEQMADQQLSDDLEKEAENDRSIRVLRAWVRDNEDEWSEACLWIRDQYERLCLILKDFDRMNGETIN